MYFIKFQHGSPRLLNILHIVHVSYYTNTSDLSIETTAETMIVEFSDNISRDLFISDLKRKLSFSNFLHKGMLIQAEQFTETRNGLTRKLDYTLSLPNVIYYVTFDKNHVSIVTNTETRKYELTNAQLTEFIKLLKNLFKFYIEKPNIIICLTCVESIVQSTDTRLIEINCPQDQIFLKYPTETDRDLDFCNFANLVIRK